MDPALEAHRKSSQQAVLDLVLVPSYRRFSDVYGEGMLYRMFLPSPGSDYSVTEVVNKVKGHVRLVPSQQSVLEGTFAIENFLTTKDKSQPFKLVADLKRM